VTDREKNKKFVAARREVIKARTQILRGTAAEILALLKDVQEQIAAILLKQPSDYQRWYLPALNAEIERVLAQWATDAGQKLSASAGTAWEAGQTLVDEPISAAGIRVVAQLPAVSTMQLAAMRAFMVDRIKNISVEAQGKIGGQLGLVAVGGQSPGDAIGHIQQILEGSPRQRAITIVRTELGRNFATATQARMVQAREILPGLQKQWRRSGKIKSRLKHDLMDGQIRPVDKPFVIGRSLVVDEAVVADLATIMYPHDPAAPARETINCGCVSLPYMAHWDMATPGKRPFSAEEIALNPNKEGLANGPSLKELGI
jgi:hypothetical protein